MSPQPFNDRLLILETLGPCAMGTVYRARDLALSRDVALGKRETTWAAYRRFCADTKRAAPSAKIKAFLAGKDHPAFNVTWEDATA